MLNLLEDRLEILDASTVLKVLSALKEPHINPRENWRKMPYLKDELVFRISDEIAADTCFGRILYSAVNKDVLKRVLYGIMSSGEMPDKFLQTLTQWERVYFFRGRWSERTPDLTQPLEVLASNHIYLGLSKLHEDHFRRKAQGEYTSVKKFPEADRVREDYKRITQLI